ncbi:MAG: hydantoinase B/oxoprolinase family protein [Mesorhizobium sp.]|uniref:hydantoinase B/oxoprolinase family protein n=1 Tax=Mesorhizobium sp. TaxID=1871066 RepID=UPI000FE90960|nr:hydantoinase B/oxoprolinase family protein [Mesorhizobium sp.]RWE82225.1 MAG: hydantoinase B/oxoprolinase family protein [Mesorhizobium sp.]TJW65848.1 MAG: hydantoinase B/oxoprolinase family protein [Mesorhizobium sp.]
MLDPVQLAIMSNRVEAIVREMTNTVLLSARSSMIGMARDFSCAIVTGNNELLSAAEALPIHIYGVNLQAETMSRLHPGLKPGDAYLHNDPYLGNSHAADHTFLVPVFHEHEHLFTTVVKTHQADCGNSVPTTYFAAATDVYQEGSLIFPCIRIQEDFKDCEDIVRMCRSRIRIPGQWYGDYLSSVGACRIGEERLKSFVEKYGVDTVRTFIAQWFDYSERRCAQAIRKLPAGSFEMSGRLDALPPFQPSEIIINVKAEIDPVNASIVVDLRDNPDCVESGINQTEATATANAMTAVFNCLDHDIPHNSGSFRRIKVLLRENCVAGIPQFPHSCSTATTLVADVIVNTTQAAFSQLGDGFGLAEGNCCNSVGASVISGKDRRRDEAPFVNQIFLMGGGGPASPQSDGMVYLLVPPAAGLLYRDSVEVDEQRYPMLVRSMTISVNSAGAGRFRGGPGTEVVFGPHRGEMLVMTISNGQENPPRGVHGGKPGRSGANFKIERDGSATKLDAYVVCPLAEGEWIKGIDNGGGGYGDPLDRSPDRVLYDIVEGYETIDRARDVYGVVFEGSTTDDNLSVDVDGTRRLRLKLSAGAR